MRLHDDLSLRTAVHAGTMDWSPSPAPGVERRMLYRVGDEIARATTIVRFAPHSRFPGHSHGGGEEILVLDGVFSDEFGDYPAGSYLRNPPGTAHTPASEPGCTLLVKLWQFNRDDEASVFRRPEETKVAGARGEAVLFDSPTERVRIESWPAGAAISAANPHGLELLVLDGGFEEGGEVFAPLSWLRLPPGRPLDARAGLSGVKFWSKSGPLLQPRVPAL
jgi:anti-sigma factor ChrR (cupin superfamily)